MIKYLTELLLLLDKKDKKRLATLIIFALFISVVETIGISAIMPFINIAINFDNIHSNVHLQRIDLVYNSRKKI